MSTGATIADWIGTAVTSVAALLYGYWALYPRKDGGHKPAVWMLAPAIMGIILESSLLLDLGGTIRSDAVEFNYERWIYFTLSLLATSATFGAYLWFEFVNGWYLMSFGTLLGVTTTLAGLATGDRRWVLFAAALAFGITWVIFLFSKSQYNSPEAKNARSGGSKFAAFFLSIAYAASIALAFITYMFSDALINIMSFPLVTWMYFGAVCATVLLPIISVYDYQPDIVNKND